MLEIIIKSLQLVHILKNLKIKNGSFQFVTEITLLQKSMIPMPLKYQNWVEQLSGNKRILRT
tara:strand:+ start:290 stop:475 length:186 start_codon:yes stop_codon:yes gene_type:complete